MATTRAKTSDPIGRTSQRPKKEAKIRPVIPCRSPKNMAKVTAVTKCPDGIDKTNGRPHSCEAVEGLEQYLDELAARGLRPVTIRYAARVLRQLEEHVGLEGLTPRRVLEYCQARGLASSSRYSYYSVAAGYSAYRCGDGIDPFRMARRPKPAAHRPRPMTDEQLVQILARASRAVREYTILAAYAGLRRGEIAGVSTEHLTEGLLGPVLLIPEGKGGIPGQVPAHRLVVEVLEAYPPGRLYQLTPESVGAAASREYRRLGLRLSLHMARHSYATRLYRSSKDVQVVQQALRHERLDTTARYIQPHQGDLFDAILEL